MAGRAERNELIRSRRDDKQLHLERNILFRPAAPSEQQNGVALRGSSNSRARL